MRGKMDEGPLHRLELGDLGLERGNMFEGDLFHGGAGAGAVAPECEELGDLGD
jgi:hypothetical protein